MVIRYGLPVPMDLLCRESKRFISASVKSSWFRESAEAMLISRDITAIRWRSLKI